MRLSDDVKSKANSDLFVVFFTLFQGGEEELIYFLLSFIAFVFFFIVLSYFLLIFAKVFDSFVTGVKYFFISVIAIYLFLSY